MTEWTTDDRGVRTFIYGVWQIQHFDDGSFQVMCVNKDWDIDVYNNDTISFFGESRSGYEFSAERVYVSIVIMREIIRLIDERER
jgi:hypothetical protein